MFGSQTDYRFSESLYSINYSKNVQKRKAKLASKCMNCEKKVEEDEKFCSVACKETFINSIRTKVKVIVEKDPSHTKILSVD